MDRAVEQIVDEILVMDCERGRVKAMELLVSRWQKRLWCYAYNLTGNNEAAWGSVRRRGLCDSRTVSINVSLVVPW